MLQYDTSDANELAEALEEVFETTEIGREYLRSYHTEDGWEDRFDLIKSTTIRVAADTWVTDQDVAQALRLLIKSGRIKPLKAAAAPLEDVVDTRPKDKLGRPMSPKAIQWQQWEQWCNDPKTSMREIDALRVSDPAFREFYEYQRTLRVKEQPNDTFDPAPAQAAAGPELMAFAESFNKAPVASLRAINGAVTLNGQKYSKAAFDALVEAATAARLI